MHIYILFFFNSNYQQQHQSYAFSSHLSSGTWVLLWKLCRCKVIQPYLLPEVSYRISHSPWSRHMQSYHAFQCRGVFSGNWERLNLRIREWFSGKKIVSRCCKQRHLSTSHIFPYSPFTWQMKDNNLLRSYNSNKSLSTTQWPLCRQGYKGYYFFSYAWICNLICNLAASYGNQGYVPRSHTVSVQHWANACRSREIFQTFIHQRAMRVWWKELAACQALLITLTY